ncbi:hypothetical protein, partial [Salmonella sp. s54412]|uniref:hypothetical protein n=1 Tax=Salmonella sp. s54412 TaxID=3160128 RepID=UPI003753FE19
QFYANTYSYWMTTLCPNKPLKNILVVAQFVKLHLMSSPFIVNPFSPQIALGVGNLNTADTVSSCILALVLKVLVNFFPLQAPV